MAGKLKPAGRLAIVVLVGIVVFLGAKWYMARPKTVGTSQTIGKVTVPDTDEPSLNPSSATKFALPSERETGT